MKIEKNQDWKKYRHPEFLEELSTSELKFAKLFLNQGKVINEILRERKTKQDNRFKKRSILSKIKT